MCGLPPDLDDDDAVGCWAEDSSNTELSPSEVGVLLLASAEAWIIGSGGATSMSDGSVSACESDSMWQNNCETC